jgi:hypothetical protein
MTIVHNHAAAHGSERADRQCNLVGNPAEIKNNLNYR